MQLFTLICERIAYIIKNSVNNIPCCFFNLYRLFTNQQQTVSLKTGFFAAFYCVRILCSVSEAVVIDKTIKDLFVLFRFQV